jgi:hypothetical protein
MCDALECEGVVDEKKRIVLIVSGSESISFPRPSRAEEMLTGHAIFYTLSARGY